MTENLWEEAHARLVLHPLYLLENSDPETLNNLGHARVSGEAN